MKITHWLFLFLIVSIVFQPFITAGTHRAKEKLLSANQKQLLGKVERAVVTLAKAFFFLLGAVALVSIHRNGHKLEMSISESWLWTVTVAAVCATTLRLLKEKYSAEENH